MTHTGHVTKAPHVIVVWQQSSPSLLELKVGFKSDTGVMSCTAQHVHMAVLPRPHGESATKGAVMLLPMGTIKYSTHPLKRSPCQLQESAA